MLPDFPKPIRFALRASLGLRSALSLHRWIAAAVSVLAASAFCITLPETPAQPRVSEYAVKAAYLLNFGKFIRVPGHPQTGAFNICILGQDPFGRSLDDLTANESIDGRPVHVLRLSRADGSHECSIEYIAAAEMQHFDEALPALTAADVLTVSDAPDFLQHGGMIKFVLVSSHVRFAVNLDAVHRSHIVLSSELLRVAASVTGNGPGQAGGNGEGRP